MTTQQQQSGDPVVKQITDKLYGDDVQEQLLMPTDDRITFGDKSITVRDLPRSGTSRGGTPTYAKHGPLRADIYVDLPTLKAAGFDPSKPITVTITQD